MKRNSTKSRHFVSFKFADDLLSAGGSLIWGIIVCAKKMKCEWTCGVFINWNKKGRLRNGKVLLSGMTCSGCLFGRLVIGYASYSLVLGMLSYIWLSFGLIEYGNMKPVDCWK